MECDLARHLAGQLQPPLPQQVGQILGVVMRYDAIVPHVAGVVIPKDIVAVGGDSHQVPYAVFPEVTDRLGRDLSEIGLVAHVHGRFAATGLLFSQESKRGLCGLKETYQRAGHLLRPPVV